MDRDESGFVDLLDWNEMIATDRKFSEVFTVVHPEVHPVKDGEHDLLNSTRAENSAVTRENDCSARTRTWISS